ncbi:MAG: protein kinase [Byssovorax sp.]
MTSDAWIGRIISDRYRVKALLGEGGMGLVLHARHLRLDEEVAIKVLRPSIADLPGMRARFVREARAASQIKSKHVVRVIDVGVDVDVPFMVMEYLEGLTLAALGRREGQLEIREATRHLLEACDAIAEAHGLGIVHRDLKPGNLFLTRPREGARFIKVLDFGISKVDAPGELEMTRPGETMGSPSYMAPEQMLSLHDADERSDIWSLGAVLYQLLTGRPPFVAETMQRLCAMVLRDAPPPPTRFCPDLPVELEGLLLRCLERQPADRFPSVPALAAALAPFAGAGASPSSTRGTALSSATVVEPRAIHHEAPASRETTSLRRSAAAKSAGSTNGSELGPLAVLALHYVGPPEHAYLGRTIADELVDTLAQIRGVMVLGTGATAAFTAARDPMAIGKALGATLVLDGTLQLAPDGRTRMVVRLIDAATGSQRSSSRHEGVLGDLFEFQASIARAVAERLRVELMVLSYEGNAPHEAIEHYFAARRDLRAFDSDGALTAIDGFGRCLELAPHFLPAVSGYALATSRAWFFDRGVRRVEGWQEPSKQAVARALAEAPQLTETHLAAAVLAVQETDFTTAQRALDRALGLAPSYVEALEYSGMLLSEAGKVDAALEKLALVTELDPSRPFPWIYSGCVRALMGDFTQAEGHYARAERLTSGPLFSATIQRVRLAAWRGDPSSLTLSDAVLTEMEGPRWKRVRFYVAVLRGEMSEAEAARISATLLAAPHSPRALASMCVLLSEIWLLLGRPERAFVELERASKAGLLDILWLDRCSLLAPLRSAEGFVEVQRRTRRRAEAIRA